ncbi:F-box protein [Robbsia andropogonis]|uniref:hypothetical protein n=1 Tax=Robbsia andropogonis TaxID=28092 RepID=UPI0004666AA2|nr:hypothetical protein [Robbsia andropogonis]
MYVFTNALSNVSSYFYSSDSNDKATSPHAQDATNHSDSAIQTLPRELVLQSVTSLTASSIVNLGLTCKHFHTLLQPTHKSCFESLIKIERTRFGSPPDVLFAQAFESIMAVPMTKLHPGLFRDLTETTANIAIWCYYDHSLNGLKQAVATAIAQMKLPPESLFDALALMDLVVVRWQTTAKLGSETDHHDAILKQTNEAFWPEMLESLMASKSPIMVDTAAQLFVQRYQGTMESISAGLASRVAVALFFHHPDNVKPTGEWVRETMCRRFGVTNETQWNLIDLRIAGEIYVYLGPKPGLAFDELCERWRPGDTAFVILAEKQSIARNGSRVDFGDRPMVTPATTVTPTIWTKCKAALDFWNGQ